MTYKRSARIYTYDTEFGNHYSVALKDENGRTVSAPVMKDMNEAKRVKENWESGRYEYLTE